MNTQQNMKNNMQTTQEKEGNQDTQLLKTKMTKVLDTKDGLPPSYDAHGKKLQGVAEAMGNGG